MCSLSCFKTLHRGVSIISPSVCKQNVVYFSLVAFLNHREQVETPTEVSCFSGAGLTHPAVASPLLADEWAYPHRAVADFGTVPGPPAARTASRGV